MSVSIFVLKKSPLSANAEIIMAAWKYAGKAAPVSRRVGGRKEKKGTGRNNRNISHHRASGQFGAEIASPKLASIKRSLAANKRETKAGSALV